MQLITDTDDDARTINTPGEKSTDPPKPHHNWLAKLFGKGGALEPVVRADSGSQPDYIGNEEFYATHVKQGGAIIVVRTPAVRAKNWRMLTALVVSSAPWSITFNVSSRPMIAAVTWMPPVPHP